MSDSPLPPDPYEALGVGKDCDLDEIKKAHRKLVLKHHPDRIKDPALVEQGKIEFQKVQQAYELLIDPVRRDRYNDQCKLAQLRKERMMSQSREVPRDSPARDSYTRSSYPTPPSAQQYNAPPRREPMPQQPRQTQTPQPMYEERAPNDSYFDIPKYDEPLPRGHTRKAETHERRTSAPRAAEKASPKPKATAWERDRPSSSSKGVGGAANVLFGINQFKKAGEAAAKKKVAAESRAYAEKKRDVDQKRDRDMKQNYNRYAPPHVEDIYDSGTSESSSDDDEPVVKGRNNFARDRSPGARDVRRDRSPVHNPRPRSPVRKSTRDRSPIPRSIGRERSPSATLRPTGREEPKSKSQSHLTTDFVPRATSPRPQKTTYFDVGHESPDEHHDPWVEKHRNSVDYIQASRKTGRPPVSRQNSDIDQQYWTASVQRDHKRSGSDSDRQRNERPHPVHKSSHRRSEPREYESSRPGLSSHTSAPAANMRTMAQESIPTRPRQNSSDPREMRSYRREMADAMPPLNRTGSAPIPRSESKRDTNAPIRESKLKQTETHRVDTNPVDSGYGSGSAPHTPDTGGESPPNERERDRERERERERDRERAHERPGVKRESSKIYKVSRDAQDTRQAHKVTPAQPIAEEPFPPMKKFLSPEDISGRPVEEHRERRGSRTRDDDPRSRPTRGERRPSMTRNETLHEERPSRSKHTHRSPERSSSRTVPMDPNANVKYSTQRSAPPKYATYSEAPTTRHHGHHRHSEAKLPRTNLWGQIVG